MNIYAFTHLRKIKQVEIRRKFILLYGQLKCRFRFKIKHMDFFLYN